jgi:Holliday junction resolvasome RuvABC endonuclease subunit
MRPAVLGLDLSLTASGLAMIDEDGDVFTHRVLTKGKAGATVTQTADRIGRVVREITQWILEDALLGRFQLAVIEAPSFGSKGGAAHERGGVWWGVAVVLAEVGIPIATVAPKTRAIYAVGHGNGKGKEGKAEVFAATKLRYPWTDLADDNEGDALLLAAMGARHLDHPIETHGTLPATHLRAMRSARWPE